MTKKDDDILVEFLVLLLQELKKDPFERLLEICNPLVEVYANRYYFKDYETEDILQEGRKVLVKAVDEFKIAEGLPFRKFYNMKLKNHMNMLVRKEHAQKRKINTKTCSLDHLMEEAGDYIQGTAPIMTNPEEFCLVKEKFDSYMEYLSPFEKEVFELYLNGTSVNEAAKLLDCKETKIKNAWYRCGIKFKELLD